MTVAKRDDFTVSTKRSLMAASGTQCSNPNCCASTLAGKQGTGESNTIGKAAHITAASMGGPRYDPGLSTAQRKSYDNGIWLCSNCATAIDVDPVAYPVEMLKSWKAAAEARARAQLGKPSPMISVLQDQMLCKMCCEPIKKAAKVCMHCQSRIERGMPSDYADPLLAGVMICSLAIAGGTTNRVAGLADWNVLSDTTKIFSVGTAVFVLAFIIFALLIRHYISPRFAEQVHFRRKI